MKRPRALRCRTGEVRKVVHRTATAAECLGGFEAGASVTGVTAGQFSAIDALEHIAAELGDADVMVSTWTTGLYDAERGAQLRDAGGIKRVRMLLDRSTFEKSPQYAGPLIDAIGPDSIRCLSVHAKVIVAMGARGAAAFRSSMNLNKNLRTEQFDLSWCPDVAAFYADWFEALWDESGNSQDNGAIIRAVYDRFAALPAETKPERKSGRLIANPWRNAT
jgi:hypothetical protein